METPRKAARGCRAMAWKLAVAVAVGGAVLLVWHAWTIRSVLLVAGRAGGECVFVRREGKSGNYGRWRELGLCARPMGVGTRARVIAPGSDATWIAVSPDGRGLLYGHGRYHVYGDLSVAPVSADGQALSPRPLLGRELPVGQAAWSPSGAQVALAVQSGSRSRIGILDWRDSARLDEAPEMTYLTDGHHSDTWPTWAPDSRRVAFVREGLELCVTERGGGMETLQSEKAGRRFGGLAWSPDGLRIAALVEQVWDGEELLGLVDTSGRDLPVRTVTRATMPGRPVWVGDSRLVLYSHAGAIWCADVQTGRRARLTDGATWGSHVDLWPQWVSRPLGELSSILSGGATGRRAGQPEA